MYNLIASGRDLPGRTDWGIERISSPRSRNFYQILSVIKDDNWFQPFLGFSDLKPHFDDIMLADFLSLFNLSLGLTSYKFTGLQAKNQLYV